MEQKQLFAASALVKWYEVKGRKNLPWRNTKDAYKILIAELMLQKTHAIQQVLPVYEVFVKKFPTPYALLDASVDEIKEVIQSLGLQNTRSRRLKELADVLVHQFKGEVPKGYAFLISLPGVGEYVANAVECIAFNQPKVMVDANVGRVLGRVFFGKEEYPPSKYGTKKIAEELLQLNGFKELNLAIIDLGALVCIPKSPKCSECPLCDVCIYAESKNKCKFT